mmetsp:Transcript_11057/g.14403  ORF Transcript_11057/g.14403 Transcript_11057/m.14403 type:complete len:410 (-) Transcript_11057:1898-3127(-)
MDFYKRKELKRKSTEACRYFGSKHGCRSGEACRFSHVSPTHHLWKRRWTPRLSNRGNFKLLSLNLLAKSLVTTDHYRYCLDYISWEYRQKLIINHVKEVNCDLLCFQEVDQDDFDGEFTKALQHQGFIGAYKKRTGDKCDGCAVYFKQSRFKLIGRPIEIEFKRPGDPLLDRDNVAIALVLQDIDASVNILVASTHILFNPKRGDVKLAQTNLLLHKLSEVSEQHNAAVILCGDFNSTPDSAFYHFVFNSSLNGQSLDRRHVSGQTRIMNKLSRFGKKAIRYDKCGHCGSGSFLGRFYDDANQNSKNLNQNKTNFNLPERLHKLVSPLTLSSAYAEANTEGNCTGEPAFTSFHSSFTGTVDYIGFQNQKFKLCGILELPNSKAFWNSQLPNKVWGSDHLSLCCELKYIE